MKQAMKVAAGTVCIALTVLVFLGLTAAPSAASFVGDKCSPNHAADDYHRRKDALAYALVGVGEGYEWGGGCWNDN